MVSRILWSLTIATLTVSACGQGEENKKDYDEITDAHSDTEKTTNAKPESESGSNEEKNDESGGLADNSSPELGNRKMTVAEVFSKFDIECSRSVSLIGSKGIIDKCSFDFEFNSPGDFNPIFLKVSSVEAPITWKRMQTTRKNHLEITTEAGQDSWVDKKFDIEMGFESPEGQRFVVFDSKVLRSSSQNVNFGTLALAGLQRRSLAGKVVLRSNEDLGVFIGYQNNVPNRRWGINVTADSQVKEAFYSHEKVLKTLRAEGRFFELEKHLLPDFYNGMLTTQLGDSGVVGYSSRISSFELDKDDKPLEFLTTLRFFQDIGQPSLNIALDVKVVGDSLQDNLNLNIDQQAGHFIFTNSSDHSLLPMILYAHGKSKRIDGSFVTAGYLMVQNVSADLKGLESGMLGAGQKLSLSKPALIDKIKSSILMRPDVHSITIDSLHLVESLRVERQDLRMSIDENAGFDIELAIPGN